MYGRAERKLDIPPPERYFPDIFRSVQHRHAQYSLCPGLAPTSIIAPCVHFIRPISCVPAFKMQRQISREPQSWKCLRGAPEIIQATDKRKNIERTIKLQLFLDRQLQYIFVCCLTFRRIFTGNFNGRSTILCICIWNYEKFCAAVLRRQIDEVHIQRWIELNRYLNWSPNWCHDICIVTI
jgi:hypothetical protein